MRVLSLLHGIYLAVEHASTGILDIQQVLEDHEVVVGVCRHHALRRALDKGVQLVEDTEVGWFCILRATNMNFVSALTPLSGLGARQIHGLVADCAVLLWHFTFLKVGGKLFIFVFHRSDLEIRCIDRQNGRVYFSAQPHVLSS